MLMVIRFSVSRLFKPVVCFAVGLLLTDLANCLRLPATCQALFQVLGIPWQVQSIDIRACKEVIVQL